MRRIFKKKNLSEVCERIDQIILTANDTSRKSIYGELISEFDDAMSDSLDYQQIDDLCRITYKIAQTKNKVLRYIEKDIWREMPELPLRFFIGSDLGLETDELLEPNENYSKESKNILSRLLRLSFEILALEGDKGRSNEIRRAGALKITSQLSIYYVIPEVKQIFIRSINSLYLKEQLEALNGLEIHYKSTNEEIDSSLIRNLNEILKKTKDRSIASTCLQIQINAGVLDKTSAFFSLDDWKDKHC